jgi:hypothetical protein
MMLGLLRGDDNDEFMAFLGFMKIDLLSTPEGQSLPRLGS